MMSLSWLAEGAKMIRKHKFISLTSKVVLALAVAWLVSGCAGNPTNERFSAANAENGASSITKINTELKTSVGPNAREYRLGFGDTLDVLIYQAETLSREYQVNSRGEIQMPLVGAVVIGGLTVSEAQLKIKSALTETYMRNPQVTVSILEYGANEISVTGLVQQPDLYKIKEGRNPFEMLTMAGGLAKGAGRYMHVTTRQLNEESGYFETVRLVVDLESHFNPVEPEDFENQRKVRDLVLKDGDNVYVPEAGLVYIDGAIKKPGSYAIERDTTISSLIALAGGANWSSSKGKVRVVRKVNGVSEVQVVNLAKITANKAPNFVLQPGDLVVLGYNPLKRGLEGFFQYGLRLAFLF